MGKTLQVPITGTYCLNRPALSQDHHLLSFTVPSHILDQHGTGGERPYYRGAMNGRYPIEQRDRSYSDSRVGQ